jgi:hypothetical protein
MQHTDFQFAADDRLLNGSPTRLQFFEIRPMGVFFSVEGGEEISAEI